ncbi:GNAT family N-acetyltransferase, partial [Loigolactobacillus coryniformis]
GGHIGYSVRPTQRRRGYGRQMLALVLPYAQARGLKRVLLTCATTNIGSQKVITSNGGRLADTVNTTRPTQRYWINLT